MATEPSVYIVRCHRDACADRKPRYINERDDGFYVVKKQSEATRYTDKGYAIEASRFCNGTVVKLVKKARPDVKQAFDELREAVGGAYDGIDVNKMTHDNRHEEGEHDDCSYCLEERKK